MLQALEQNPSKAELEVYMERCRTEALLGSCPRSHSSFLSGVASWTFFAGHLLGKRGKEFPPTAGDLTAWSMHFEVAGRGFGRFSQLA